MRPALLVIIWLLAFAAGPSVADDNADQRKKLEQLRQEMQQLRSLIKEFQGQRSELQSALEESEVDIGQIQTQVRKIQQQLQREQSELEQLQRRKNDLKEARQGQQKLIEQQILAAYQIGQQNKIKILLNQEQPYQVSRALTYYDYFNQARGEQIAHYTDIIAELNQVEPAIAEKARSLADAKADLDRQHQRLLASQREREQNLARINSAIQSKDQRLKQVAKDRRALEQLLQAVEETIANIAIPSDYQPFTALRGKLPWPVVGKPNNRFGASRSGGLRWQGLNIPAREGSSVRAIHHGRVMFADWLRGSGLLLIIDHGDGYMSLYAHNQSLLKETGDWVSAGEEIATVGASGGQASAGLYFEIRHNGKPTDPRRWCRRA